MKKEYDFSKGERGKFYHENVQLNIPIYLDNDVAEFIQKAARKTKMDSQTIVNKILCRNKGIIQTLQ